MVSLKRGCYLKFLTYPQTTTLWGKGWIFWYFKKLLLKTNLPISIRKTNRERGTFGTNSIIRDIKAHLWVKYMIVFKRLSRKCSDESHEVCCVVDRLAAGRVRQSTEWVVALPPPASLRTAADTLQRRQLHPLLLPSAQRVKLISILLPLNNHIFKIVINAMI